MVVGKIAKQGADLRDEITRTETPDGGAAFWWLGQHTFIMKAGGKVFYLDPWFAAWDSRQVAPLLAAEQADNGDYALITHGHGDHLCPETLRGLKEASPNAHFFCPETEAARLTGEADIPASRLTSLTAGDVWEQGGVRITAIKSKHEFFDEHPALGFPYLGYVIEVAGAGGTVRFYHSGDTINYEGLLTTLQTFPRLDAIFVPINGRDAERFASGCIGNFTYQEAAELAGELGVGLVVPSHYDMFVGNQEDSSKFARFLSAKYPAVPHWIGDYGKLVRFGLTGS